VILDEIEDNDSLLTKIYKVLPKRMIACKIFLKSNDITKAQNCYKEILQLSSLHAFPEYQIDALSSSAYIDQILGDFKSSVSKYNSAIAAIEKQRSSIGSESSKLGFVDDKQNIYFQIVKILTSKNKNARAFNFVERAKSRALVDTLASKKQFGNQATKKSNQLLVQLDKAELESLQFVANNNGQTRSKEAKSKIILADKQLSSLVTVKAIKLSDIQSTLKPDESIVEYYGNNENYFIFVLTKNSIKSVKINSSNLESIVTNYRTALSARDSKQYKSASKKLYNAVIKPVKHLIKGKKLTIVPHGSLHYVPFASLWDGKQFLVQKYQIRTLPSASVMEFLQKKVKNKAGNLLVLGNPDLGDPDYDLPGAQDEALRLAKANKGAKVLLRKNATETALKKFGSSFKNIHFAMHGIFEAEKPLTSGLLLAPDSENDGRLTVSELYDLELNADLVTLSACETALGETKSGDDVIGFTRGFLYAGANSIVSSLWEVDDDATRDLMLRFYKELKSNNKARALQKAQLRVMKKYPHPYYWAAFQLTGQY
jgi:CHAT domain-containing protein